tara:strand:- start:931 stop:1176 length:246 start_codon:yes stop_codon:yes gene_type:complete
MPGQEKHALKLCLGYTYIETENTMNNELLKLTPELVLFVKKLIQHSRGGLTKDERQELAADVINLLYKVLKELVDTETESE